MALIEDLLGWWPLEENFDEEIWAVNSVPPNAGTLTGGLPIAGTQPLMQVNSVPGKVNKGAQFVSARPSAMLSPDATMFQFQTSKTFAIWFKFSAVNAGNQILQKGLEYTLRVDAATRKLVITGASGTFILYPTVLSLDTWYAVRFWRDTATGLAYIQVNDGAIVSGTITSNLTGSFLLVGSASGIDGVLDELAIWDRILTAAEWDEFYNNGEGTTYASIQPAGACRSLECCDDNPADYVSQGGTGQGYDSTCEPLPRVLFEPVSGTRLILPSLVTLRSDNPDAVIHYTTDGSTPDRNSPTYSTPLTISAPAELIRAIAIVEGCPEGPEAVAQYQQWTPAAHFTYGCGTVDKSGQWLAFAADGNPDYNWQLQIQFSAVTGVKEFQVLQLFPDGTFTGSGWSTNEFIYPWADPTQQHRAFPLVMWNPDHTGAQVNLAYVTDFSSTYGNFGIGAHTRTLYGSPWTSLPATHLFKLKIIFQDGTTLERIVDTTCDALPGALCPVPSLAVSLLTCGPKTVHLQYTLGIGTPRKIFRSNSPTGPWTELISGNVAASPETYSDATVLADTEYYYYIANIPAGCASYVNSAVIGGVFFYDAVVEISASPGTINAGDSTTISWASANNSGTVSISPTIGVQPGNVPGNQVVAPAVTTTYIITGQSGCLDPATAQVTVTVIPPASCGAVQPDVVRIDGYSSSFFGSGGCTFRTGGVVAWNGSYANDIGCTFLPPESPVGPVPYHFGSSDGVNNRELHFTNTKITQGGGLWTLEVWGYDDVLGNPLLAWRGTKAVGDTPVGTYSRTSGCSATPTTLDVIAV